MPSNSKPIIKTKVANPFEKIQEELKNSARKVTKDIVSPFNPTNLFEELLGIQNSSDIKKNEMSKEFQKNPNMTPLDLQKLQNKYADKDQEAKMKLRNKLFNMVKSADEKLLQDQKQKKQEIQYKEQQEKQQKEQKKQAHYTPLEPMGKIRKNIFGKTKRKANPVAGLENKPNKGSG